MRRHARAEELEIHKTDSGQGVPSTDETDPVARTMPVPSSVVPGPRPGPRPGPPARRPVPGPPAGPARVPKPGPAARRSAPAAADAQQIETPQIETPQIETQLLPSVPEGALDRADEAVDLLLETGRAPEQILVLTTAGPHPWQEHEESFGAERYWAQLDEAADVFYAQALPCRTARREVVVLAVNGGDAAAVAAASAKAREHATRLLLVCGPAD